MAGADFPHSDVIGQIAEIARIPSEYRELFRCKLETVIRNVTEFHERRTPAKSKRIAERLARIGALVEQLQNEPDEKGNAERLQKTLEKAEWPIRVILDCGLSVTGRTSYDAVLANPEINLQLLGSATQWSVAIAKRPAHRSAGIRTVFDVLVFQILITTHICHAKRKLTIYDSKHSDSGWDGRLLSAVRLLRPILPKGLVPRGSLGNTLKRIADLFEAYVSKL